MRLEAPVTADDGSGGTTASWNLVTTLWARVEPLSAVERLTAERLEAAVTHRVTIRHRAGVTHRMRFVLGTRVLEIRGIRDLEERHRYLELTCEEVSP
ncbi:putative head-tail adaptor [Lutibaculum baratangense AMV1]|uniref:Putative head-tail adaptor n=1 Tax=Lutibaculum baratangense AMV1 TaxID=631454 RepID=V4RHQ3_9HYPH|nr:putative head-tail adaptor [Lutibaculum baratangense AMV1]